MHQEPYVPRSKTACQLEAETARGAFHELIGLARADRAAAPLRRGKMARRAERGFFVVVPKE